MFDINDKLLQRVQLVKQDVCIHHQVENLDRQGLHLDILIDHFVDLTESSILQNIDIPGDSVRISGDVPPWYGDVHQCSRRLTWRCA